MGLGQTVRQLGGGLAALGVRVERPAAAIPKATTDDLFVVYYGKILLTSIVGQVTIIIAGGANNTKLEHTPDTGPTPGLAAEDLCTVLDINGHDVDTIYTITGNIDALVDDEKSGVENASMLTLLILQPGTIALNCVQAAGTGSIKWVLQYVALDKYAVVRPAA